MTKKFLLMVTILIGLAVTSNAQNRKIAFDENEPWKSVVEKAIKADRPIFMDCYTDWCGPCKMLDRNVFSNDQIADYYNEKFINAKYDMEKGEGPSLKDKYGISAYPTLLFIDPKTEQVIHRVVGAGSVEHMMEQAKIAVDPANNLAGIKAAFEAGEKNAAQLAEYMQALRRAGMSAEQNRVTIEYLEGMTLDDFIKEENWKLFESYVTDPLSIPAQMVFANRRAFSQTVGAEKVNSKLSSTLMMAVNRFRNKEQEPVKDFDQERFDKLMAFLTDIEDQAAPGCLVQLYAAGYAQSGDYAALAETLRNTVKYNMIQIGKQQLQPVFLMTYLTKFVGRTDKQVQSAAIELIDEIIEAAEDNSRKGSFTQIKALLLESYGDTAGAAKAKEQADEFRKNGGGPIMMRIG